MVSIALEHVSKSFHRQDGDTLHVLDAVSLQIPEHAFYCVLGPSGTGKSTILNMICGIESPDEGEVRFSRNGSGDAAVDREALRFGYVFQSPRLLNWRTVRENLEFALRAQRIPRAEWAGRIDHHLGLVGLRDFADEYPMALSGGMQQRVGLARALVIEPDLLLMDEPFSGLDELTARRMRENLIEIWTQEPKTVVFITHNPMEAAFLGDAVVLLTRRPARVDALVPVPVERPRNQEDRAILDIYAELVRRIVG